MSALPPTPTTWLKPTPFGSAQSSTARHSAADCETSATRPGCGWRCALDALRPSAGTTIPKEDGPSTRTPDARPASRRPDAGARQTAAKVPRAASAPNAPATPSGSVAITPRLGATGSAAMSG